MSLIKSFENGYYVKLINTSDFEWSPSPANFETTFLYSIKNNNLIKNIYRHDYIIKEFLNERNHS